VYNGRDDAGVSESEDSESERGWKENGSASASASPSSSLDSVDAGSGERVVFAAEGRAVGGGEASRDRRWDRLGVDLDCWTEGAPVPRLWGAIDGFMGAVGSRLRPGDVGVVSMMPRDVDIARDIP